MKRLTQLAGVVGLAPTLAHEASHYLVASLGTDDAEIAVEVLGGRAIAAWPPLDSAALRVAAFLAPVVWLPVIGVAWWFARVDIVSAWTLLTAGLAAMAAPSPDDIRGALGRQAAQQQDTAMHTNSSDDGGTAR
jgi:hypothetical protein